MAAPAVIDRFKQIEPKVLIACDGVTYAGRRHDRAMWSRNCAASLPTVEHVILHSDGGGACSDLGCAACRISSPATGSDDRRVRAGVAAVRSSALDRLFQRHHRPAETDRARPWRRRDRGAAADDVCTTTSAAATRRTRSASAITGTRSTGWIMWNCQVAGLLNGTTCCIFDGSPGGPEGQAGLDHAVALRRRDQGQRSSAPARRSSPVAPRPRSISPHAGDLSQLRALGSTGSPLSAETQQLVQRRASRRLPKNNGSAAQADMWWANMSGGTDFAGAFIGGNRELPQTPGAMQCRLLGCAVEAFNEQGQRRDRRGRRARLHRAVAVDAAAVLERSTATRAIAPAISKPIRTISTAAAAARSGVMATGSRSTPTAPA